MEVESVLEDKSLDSRLCVICQLNTREKLIEQPSSYDRVYNSIREWAKYGVSKYCRTWSKVKNYSPRELEDKKASWHRSCYKDATHSGMLKRTKERYERQLEGEPGQKRRKGADEDLEASTLTRSKTTPYNKNTCFFCEEPASYQQPLHNVSTTSAGETLQAAVQAINDDKLRVKLSTAINPSDGHAIDIKYHKNCWMKHVVNASRKVASATTTSNSQRASLVASQIEFLTMLDNCLSEGQIITMANAQVEFESIMKANNVENHSCSRKWLKQLIQKEIPNVEFHRSPKANESERISIKRTRDSAIHLTETTMADDDDEDIKTIFNAAILLRKKINKCQRWVFTGSFGDLKDEHLPPELYSFCRWVIQGSNGQILSEGKSSTIHNRATTLAQTVVSLCLTERQRGNKKSEEIKCAREMPQQLAVGIALRQAIRSKEIVNMLNGFGMSVEYNRLLRVEVQIEETVLKRILENNGIYLPVDFVKNRYIFFAIDNIDFSEDTPDGKRTLHGTAMAIYQKIEDDDDIPEIRY